MAKHHLENYDEAFKKLSKETENSGPNEIQGLNSFIEVKISLIFPSKSTELG